MAGNHGDSRLRVQLLGELALLDRGRPLPLPASRKTRALFVYLLLSDRPMRRDRLCDLFFDIPDDPRGALRWSLSKIRAMLAGHADALAADRERVAVLRERIVTDVEELEAMAASGTHADSLRALGEQAMEPPLLGLDLPGLDNYSAWLAAERSRIDRMRSSLLTKAAGLPDLTPEERRRFTQEAEAIAPEVAAASREAPEPAAERPVPETPALEQTVRFCTADDGVRIAYASTGAGPPLVKAANWLNHLELDWTGPVWGKLITSLSSSRQLVRYDERGNGLSQWDVADLSFDAFVRDLETVVDTLGLKRFPLLGISQGCAVSIEYAARHPHRVSRLILLGGYAAGWRHFADAEETERRRAVITLARHGWGQDNPVYRQIFSQTFMPTATHEELDWFNEFQRRTTTPDNAVRFLHAFASIDVRHRLEAVRCPTLVLHARDDQRVPIALGTELAARIPNASLVTLETDSHIPLSREPASQRIIDCIEAFLRED